MISDKLNTTIKDNAKELVEFKNERLITLAAMVLIIITFSLMVISESISGQTKVEFWRGALAGVLAMWATTAALIYTSCVNRLARLADARARQSDSQ